MNVVAIIPSRYGSSRFDGKPLAAINGLPMIQWVYQRISSAECIDQTYVATDDHRIHDAVTGFNGQVIMTSETLRSGTDRVAEAAKLLEMSSEDIVINVQGDQPLIAPECLKEVIQPLVDDPQLGMSTLAFEIIDPREYGDPKDCKVVMDTSGKALYFSRAPIPLDRDQESMPVCHKHLGIYAYRVGFLEIFSELPTGRLEAMEKLEQLRALEHGHPIQVVVTSWDSPEVDLPEDIRRIERIIRSHG
jgi:3-deoxy-manno-octulosonate cytidylyltransferase (CMP-KDO synthetase)